MSDINEQVLATQEALKMIQKSLVQMHMGQANAGVQTSYDEDQKKIFEKHQMTSYSNNRHYVSLAEEYLDFTYKSPTVYHIVDYFSKELDRAGFTYLNEKAVWPKLRSGKYYTIRNGGTLAAFILGEHWDVSKGVGIIASHVDSLTAKLKPASKKSTVNGYELLGVAPYGGALGNVWFDRDLGIGGRVLVKDLNTGKVEARLVDSTPHPIARIPTLAPHFGEPSVGPFDLENQAVPVIGFVAGGEYGGCESANSYDVLDEQKSPLYGKHSIHLLRYIAELADVKVSQLIQLELELFDVQHGTFGGLKKEFIFAPRVDDVICSFSAIHSLIGFASEANLHDDFFNAVVLFDNEEIGSLSRQGAKGGLLSSVVERVISNLHQQPSLSRTAFANSLILSSDVTHLFNPNFPEVYLEHHSPLPNVGPTIHLDPNGHMATGPVGTCILEELAAINDDKLQYFQCKNNSRSGSTIGPSIAAQTGARTIDIGIPQLSMHSTRAVVGSRDIGLAVKFFRGFFRNWRRTYDQFGDL
ncbi:metalloaminopeptidase APE1 Ecym_7393 [Eremothecium cymbalariae DBVPG|uniref:Uncharacterized protein n=1 Tax=Eremothecium cymbalariae (strain CBS 270.75 / DBVPG 7215 / KCTC 17166 / NRRL Y-17582) TaxID=931890 RepID=G8JWK4_ERECY|nr:hypothetical protein Ecym_7393 [Eremothecium cymbalariae DBVPG\